MAKNNKYQKKPNSPQPSVNQTVKAKTTPSKSTPRYVKWLAIGVLIITLFVAFSGGFDNQFVDWDDHVYIENN